MKMTHSELMETFLTGPWLRCVGLCWSWQMGGGMLPGPPPKSLLPGRGGSMPRSIGVGCQSSLSACKNPAAAGGRRSYTWGLLLI